MGEMNRQSAKVFVTKIFTGLFTFTRKFEEVTLISGIAFLAILLMVNVAFREAGHSLYFTEEIAMFLMIFIVFVGLSYGVRKTRHIRMAAIFDLMNHKTKKGLTIFTSVAGALVMFFMTYQSVLYVSHVFRMHTLTQALLLPYWIFLAIVPVGFFFAGLHYVLTIAKNISSEEVWLSPEQKSEYEDEESTLMIG